LLRIEHVCRIVGDESQDWKRKQQELYEKIEHVKKG
jgi:hypothetical protein